MTSPAQLLVRLVVPDGDVATDDVQRVVQERVRALGLPLAVALDVAVDPHADALGIWIGGTRLRYSRETLLRARMTVAGTLLTVADADATLHDPSGRAMERPLRAHWFAAIVEHAIAARPTALLPPEVIAQLAASGRTPEDLETLIATVVSCGVGFRAEGLFDAINSLSAGRTEARAEALLSRLHPHELAIELSRTTLGALLGTDPARDTRPFAGLHDRALRDLGFKLPKIALAIDDSLAPDTYRLRINHLREPAQPLSKPTELLRPSPNGSHRIVAGYVQADVVAADASSDGISALGYLTLDAYAQIARRAARLVDRAVVDARYAELNKPTLVALVRSSPHADRVPGVLRRLLDEQVTTADFGRILDRIVDHHTIEKSPPPRTHVVLSRGLPVSDNQPPEADQLFESVRMWLGHALLARLSSGAHLSVQLLSSALEDELATSPSAERLDLIRDRIYAAIDRAPCDALLTNLENRARVRALCADVLPGLPVLSFQELPADASLVEVGRIALAPAPAQASTSKPLSPPAPAPAQEVEGLWMMLADAHTAEPMYPEPFTDRIIPEEPTERLKKSAVYMYSAGAPPSSLEEQGWGILVPSGQRGIDLEKLVQPLIEYRRDVQRAPYQVYRVDPTLAGTRASLWANTVFEPTPQELRPRYLLILGKPNEVSFDVQLALAPFAGVGRLAFDDDLHYTDYARKAVAAEQLRQKQISSTLFLCDDGTPTTLQAREDLFNPCRESFAQLARSPRYAVASAAIASTGKKNLIEGARDANFLFTISHGAGSQMSYDERTRLQGALQTAKGELLTGSDVAGKPFLTNGVWLMFACYGAGTPARSSYEAFVDQLWRLKERRADTRRVIEIGRLQAGEQPFIAKLPMQALANPEGPLAVIGHIDLAWGYSFQYEGQSRFFRFSSAVETIMRQHCVGYAMQQLMLSCMQCSDQLAQLYEQRREAEAGRGSDVDPARLARTWMARQDLRNFILLGDPAVRLRTATGADT